MSIAAKCPAAVRNPDTQKPVDKKQVYTVLKTACYDRVPEEPWVCEPVYTRRFLPEDLMEQRLQWAKRLLREGYTDGWFYRHVVWVDLCHTIIPGDQKKALAQTFARKHKSRWHSPDAKDYNRNLSAPKHALTQRSFNDNKVWWGFVLLRGKVHVEVFGDDFPGENPDGAMILGHKLRGIVAKRSESCGRRCRNRGWSSRTAAEASTLPSGTSPSCGLARSGKACSRFQLSYASRCVGSITRARSKRAGGACKRPSLSRSKI